MHLKVSPTGRGHAATVMREDAAMRKAGLKAVLALLALRRSGRDRPDWDRIILIFSTSVTIGLVALYLFGKATSRW